MHLSVVIPAHDEEVRLQRTLPAIRSYLQQRALTAEILVVDDGSLDRTTACATELLRGTHGRVLQLGENLGKGAAVRRGLLEAAGRWALITDADLSTPISEYDKLAAAVRDRDLDVAIASRDLPDSKIEQPQPVFRRIIGRTFGGLTRRLTGLQFQDTQCGFKLLDLQRTRPIVEKQVVNGFAFDVELLFLCTRYGLRVQEIPVTWRNDERSAIRLLRDPPRMLLDLLRIRWRFRRGAYHPQLTTSIPGSPESG